MTIFERIVHFCSGLKDIGELFCNARVHIHLSIHTNELVVHIWAEWACTQTQNFKIFSSHKVTNNRNADPLRDEAAGRPHATNFKSKIG